MTDPIVQPIVPPIATILQKADAATAAVNAEAPKVAAWFAHPVPLWALGVAFVGGAFVDALRALA
jgi:hypothetical protein